MLKENVDYMFIPHPSDDKHYGIKILSGDYQGVEYFYNTISAKESNDRLSAILSFTYEVLKDPGELIVNQKDFQQFVGDVLTSIITGINQSDNPKEHMELHDQDRDDYSSELVGQ